MRKSFIGILSIIGLIAIAQSLTSCAGLSVTATTPWGDVSSSNGQTTVAPKPIVWDK
jgi:hypothetical protein